MNGWDVFWHLAGFLAPALMLAPAVVLASRLLWRGAAGGLWSQVAANAAVCVGVLLAGLALTGHDGRMGTYAALVLASAGCQALWMWGCIKK